MWQLIKCTLRTMWAKNRGQLALDYVQVPLGVVIILLLTWGVNMIMLMLPFEFPAPVVTMLILFTLFLILDRLSTLRIFWRDGASRLEGGESTPDKFLVSWMMKGLGPSINWLLRYMTLFFTPSFVLVPGRPALAARNIGLIIAWFIPSFFLAFLINVYLCKATAILPFFRRHIEEKEEAPPEVLSKEEVAEKETKTHLNTESMDSTPGDLERQKSSPRIQSQPQSHERELPRTDSLNAMSAFRPYDAQNSLEDITRVNTNIPAAQDTFISKENYNGPPLPVTTTVPRHEKVADALQPWIDPFIYSVIGVVGLILFYVHPSGEKGRGLLLFLSVNSLAFMFSTRVVPDTWKVILHPILVTSVITGLLVWALGAAIHWPITRTLQAYSTSTDYTMLFRPDAWNDDRRGPGAGDILTSILNAGIVALAYPMYQYRQDLKDHAFRMLFVILPNIVLSLFFWNFIPGSRVMGLPWELAVVFTGRFMSTPLALELVKTADGDQEITVVLVVVTGIVMILTKDHLFRWLKVGQDDTLTVGLTVGILGGAIGTSSLMKTNRRAMASATVGFVGYGLIMLCLIAITPVSQLVKLIAGR